MNAINRLGGLIALLCLFVLWAPAQEEMSEQERQHAEQVQQTKQATPTDPLSKLKASPGYLDIATDDLFSGLKSKAEVTLEKTMFQMMKAAAKENDMDVANLLDKLDLVRVLVFEGSAEKTGEIGPRIEKITQNMRTNEGWLPLVRVREDNEKVDILMKIDDERVRGIGLFVQNPSEVVFINIVGDIESEEFSKSVGGLIGKLAGGAMDMSQITQLMGAVGAAQGENETKPVTAINLSGTITAADSKEPVSGATIKVTNTNGVMIETIATDDKGKFEYAATGEGITIMVSADGYKAQTKKLPAVVFETDRPIVVDFELEGN